MQQALKVLLYASVRSLLTFEPAPYSKALKHVAAGDREKQPIPLDDSFQLARVAPSAAGLMNYLMVIFE